MAEPTFKLFQQVFNKSTKQAAIAAYKKIHELHRQSLPFDKSKDKEHSDPDSRDYKQSLKSPSERKLSDSDYKALGRLIDGAAVKAMQEVFETQPHFSVEIRGSEGRKDTRRDGIASPDLYGSYGPASGITVEIVNDAVEGTASASRNLPAATSVLAAALDQNNGLIPTGNFDYMSKLFGPPALKDKISLQLSPEENFKIALHELEIKNPADLAVVILDRPRNQFEIESAQKMGITTLLIPSGDLIPGLLAVSDPSILKTLKNSKVPKNIKGLLLMGSGGWEEGIITAAAAKALGGHAQGRIYSEDKEVIEQAKIMETADLVPARADSILISATPITNDPWFAVQGVGPNSRPKTISITHQGMEIIQTGLSD